MTEGAVTVASSAPPSRLASVRATLAAHPVSTAVTVYALVAIAAAIAAYFAIFTQFASYDDEGTMLVTIKAFVHGDVLYRDIYSPYGPFYYELFGGLFALTGWPVSTDASRLIVIVVWVTTSGLFGLAAHRLTGRLLLGATGMIVAFAALGVLVNEPMHPHGLGSLLLGGFILMVVGGLGRRIVLSGAVAGGLLAALTLTKVNLGAFAVAAVVLAAVLSVEPLRRRRWLCLLGTAIFLIMPTVVMARDLGLEWVRDFVALEFFGMAAVLVAAWPERPRVGKADAELSRWLLAGVAGFVLAFVAILSILMLTGPTPAAVYEGVVEQALRIRDAFVVPFTIPPAALDWGIGAVAAAALTSWLRRMTAGKPSIWPGLLRVAAGLTIWLTLAHASPFGFNPTANQDVLPLTLAWVAVVPPTGMPEDPFWRFLRVLLPALAVAETLQAYPVAGSQVSIAALMFVPVGALCLADGMWSLRAWSAERGRAALERLNAVVFVVMVTLLAKFAFDVIARPAATDAVLYRNQPAVGLSNAGLLHIPASQAIPYERLVTLLHHYRCSTFVAYPSLDSLYLWSSVDAPKPQLPGPWMRLLDDRQQRRVVDQLRSSPHPCAIRNESAANGWLQGTPPPDTPLVRYIRKGLRPIDQVGQFQFMLPIPRN